MNKKNYDWLVLGVLYAVLLSITAVCSFIVSDLIMRALNTVAVLAETHAASLIRLALTVIISGTLLSAVTYWEGHHFATFDKSAVFPAVGAALGAHLLPALLFGFSPWASGGVIYLAGWINYGSDYTSESSRATRDVSILIFLGAFIIFAAWYALCMTFPQYYGAVKRLAEREELFAQAQVKKTYVQPQEEYGENEPEQAENEQNPEQS